MDKHPSITSEHVRIYHAIASALGKETADRMFPHVGRFLARMDTGVRNTGQFDAKN